jgi:hypothetical protein
VFILDLIGNYKWGGLFIFGVEMMSLQIQPAYAELGKVRELFTEYQITLGLDLRFQNFEEELAFLPDKYALPYGRLYIAIFNDNLAGCIALRAIDKEYCEMKRFVCTSAIQKNRHRMCASKKKLLMMLKTLDIFVCY